MTIHWTSWAWVSPREVTSSPSFLQHNRHQERFKNMLSAAGSIRSTCTSCFSSANQKMGRWSALGWGEGQGRGPRNTHTHSPITYHLPAFRVMSTAHRPPDQGPSGILKGWHRTAHWVLQPPLQSPPPAKGLTVGILTPGWNVLSPFKKLMHKDVLLVAGPIFSWMQEANILTSYTLIYSQYFSKTKPQSGQI